MVLKLLFNCIACLIIASTCWAKGSADLVRDGNAFYRQGDYGKAAASYEDALKQGGQENVARYNLGNTYYRQGKAAATSDIDGAIEAVNRSVNSYQQVLDKDPKDADAKFNIDAARKLLKELEKKKQQQQQQQQQQQKSNDGKDNKEKDKKDDSQQQQTGSQEKEKNKDSGKKQDQQQSQQGKDKQQKEGGQGKQERKEQQSKDKGQEKQVKKEPAKDQKDKNGTMQGQMSKEEAKDILEDYQRNEEPKGMLIFMERDKGDDKPVSKDW